MKKTFFLVVLAIIAVIAFFILRDKSIDQGVSGDQASEAAAAEQSRITETLLETALSEKYTNDKYKFSFSYPAGMVPSSFADETTGGDVVTLADESALVGMQIVITPFDEDLTVLTVERIKKDQPDLTIRDSREVILGSSGKGVTFLDSADDAVAQRQIWFISSKKLYQITAPLVADALVQKMLNSWEFF